MIEEARMDEPYRIAVYLRLSKEDGESAEESNSITNQRMLLKEYVKKQDRKSTRLNSSH